MAETKKRVRMSKKKILFLVLTCIVLVAVCVGVYLFAFHEYKNDQQTAGLTVREKIEQLKKDSDVPKVVAAYDEAIKSEQNTEEKNQLKAEKTEYLTSSNQLDAALESAKEVDTANPTHSSAAELGRIYSAKFEDAEAARWYTLAAERVESDTKLGTDVRNMMKQTYSQTAERLNNPEESYVNVQE